MLIRALKFVIKARKHPINAAAKLTISVLLTETKYYESISKFC